jgi:glycosyltransferase involved in cell wall biosynthesis
LKVLLYRRRLSLRSGAGPLIAIQARELTARGCTVDVLCRRGAFEFTLRSGVRARRFSERRAALLESNALLVDHEMELPDADIVFSHNLMTRANRFLQRADLDEAASLEARFFEQLRGDALVVANSRLVRDALVDDFSLDGERIVVHYPGYRSERFNSGRSAMFRRRSRKALGIEAETPLVGLITSGDFHKRGLDTFFEVAERILASRRDAVFLVIGSKRLPDWANRHRLVTEGTVRYRSKTAVPEQWMAALDVFLYPAEFEEFGIVVTEARAMGVPVLTSRRVGAAECLPAAYERLLLDVPNAERFAELALELIENRSFRQAVAEAGLEGLDALDQRQYADSTANTILDQNR